MISPWVVHNFGGTSLADAARYREVATILQREPGARKAVVVSAMAKITDGLIELAKLAQARDNHYLAQADAIQARHLETTAELLPDPQALRAIIEADFRDLREILRGVYLSRTCSEQTVELISGYGELWSAQLLNAHLNASGIASTWLDARNVLTVEPDAAMPGIDWWIG